jgi:hypothetical protein
VSQERACRLLALVGHRADVNRIVPDAHSPRPPLACGSASDDRDVGSPHEHNSYANGAMRHAIIVPTRPPRPNPIATA